MAIVQFIQRADRRELRLMLILTLIAGLANALLVVMVNQVAGLVARGERPGALIIGLFGLGFALYYCCNRYALLRANAVIEGLLERLRVELMDKLRRSELLTVDRLGRGELYSMVSRETNHLSVAFPLLVDAFQQAVLLVIALCYLLYLSPAAFLVFLAAVLAGVVGYRWINQGLGAILAKVVGRQGQMLGAIGDIIHGGKELRLNAAKGESVHQVYRGLSASVERLLVRSGDYWASMILLSSFVTYLMLGVVGFGFPQYVQGHSLIVFELVPVLLFCVGPLAKVVAQSPLFMQAEVGLQSILAMERQLDAADGAAPERARALAPAFRDFKRIDYEQMVFSHRDAAGAVGFTAGPLNLGLARGELVFLVGGNGSGKSTSLRLMTGLYPPEQGLIRVDGVPLTGEAVAGFRELFSAIFVDFHLFDRLYGLEDVDPLDVARLIDRMGLAGKVWYENGRFSQTHLSTGQRKRLALIAALLEDRPVYVFDEWSAEQDVHFREIFYTEILPELKARGKTVVAVTHDERYWHLADRVVKLDLGRVQWERAGTELESA